MPKIFPGLVPDFIIFRNCPRIFHPLGNRGGSFSRHEPVSSKPFSLDSNVCCLHEKRRPPDNDPNSSAGDEIP